MKPYTLDNLQAAKIEKNYILVGKIAVFLMASRPDIDTHLKAGMAYAWAQEMMGDWDEALKLYMLLEAVAPSAKMAAFMVARRARVMRKLGRGETADKLLDSLTAEIATTIPDVADRRWVQEHIRLARTGIGD